MLKSHVFHAYDCYQEGNILTFERYSSEGELITDGRYHPSSPNPNPFVDVASIHPSVGAIQGHNKW